MALIRLALYYFFFFLSFFFGVTTFTALLLVVVGDVTARLAGALDELPDSRLLLPTIVFCDSLLLSRSMSVFQFIYKKCFELSNMKENVISSNTSNRKAQYSRHPDCYLYHTLKIN